MSNSMIADEATALEAANDRSVTTVRYCGYANESPWNSPARRAAITHIDSALKALRKKGVDTDDSTEDRRRSASATCSEWERLYDTLVQVRECISARPQASCSDATDDVARTLPPQTISSRFPHYSLVVLNQAVLPYVKKMTERMVLEPSRFAQLEAVLHLLILHEAQCQQQDMTPRGREHAHPARVLLELDDVCAAVKRETGIWRSQFGTLLDSTLTTLWRPILHDVKSGCQSVGTKLVVLGLVDAIGRPMLLLYPVYLILEQALAVIRAVKAEQQRHSAPSAGAADFASVLLSSTSVSVPAALQLVKAFALLLVVSKGLAVLERFQSLGTLCLLLGALLYGVSMEERLLKRYTPLLAPALLLVDQMVTQAASMEHYVTHLVRARAHSTATATGPMRPSDRVEHLRDDSQHSAPQAPRGEVRGGIPVAMPVSAGYDGASTDVDIRGSSSRIRNGNSGGRSGSNGARGSGGDGNFPPMRDDGGSSCEGSAAVAEGKKWR